MGYTESPNTDDIKSLIAKKDYNPRVKGDIKPTVSATSPMSYEDFRFSRRNWPKGDDGGAGRKPDPDAEYEKNLGSTTSLKTYEQDDPTDTADAILHKLDGPTSKIKSAHLEKYMRPMDPPIEPDRSRALGLSGPFWGYFNEEKTDYEDFLKTYPPEVKVEAAQLIHTSDTESPTVDMTDGCSYAGDADVETDLEADREHVLNHLMVCVHNMFSEAASSNGFANANTSSLPSFRQTGESSSSGSNTTGRKRGRDDTKGERNSDEDENEKSKHPRTIRDEEEVGILEKLRRKLACPYYKQDLQKHHSSGACCGPEWKSVHRIKAHLYRMHAEPLHCRRCYTTFASESLLTEHSRATDGCEKRDAIPMDGFNKDQERALKCRKAMFQANTEEEKWKHVYLILFPDAVLGEIPSPYYDVSGHSASAKDTRTLSPVPEIQEFDLFMKRELPRKIRKALQIALERKLGPIAEELKNELESIVRDAQVTLTQSYLDSVRSTSGASAEASECTGGSCSAQPLPDACPSKDNMSPSRSFDRDALSQHLVPREGISEFLPPLYFSAISTATRETSSTSAAHSSPETLSDDLIMDDAWLNTLISDEDILHDLFSQDHVGDTTFGAFGSADSSQQDQTFDQYTGKGKEPAHENSWDFDLEHLPEGPS